MYNSIISRPSEKLGMGLDSWNELKPRRMEQQESKQLELYYTLNFELKHNPDMLFMHIHYAYECNLVIDLKVLMVHNNCIILIMIMIMNTVDQNGPCFSILTLLRLPSICIAIVAQNLLS